MAESWTVDDLLTVARATADAARAPALAGFRAGVAVDDKGVGGAFDPVTSADRAAETAMRAALARMRPDDGVEGEEHADTPSRSGLVWRLDPIDGTRAFICGAPSWGVLIAACDTDGPVVGIIDQPFTGERFEGARGAGATWRRGDESRALRTRPAADLASATLMTTFPEIGDPAERAAFDAVRARVRLTRYGFDCYAYGLLALGCVDLVIEAGLHAHDVCALIPVVEGAGGRVTSWRGEPCHGGGRVLAAGDPRLHAQALEILARA